MSLQLACGTRTTVPIAPNQNPDKCRSYEPIVRTFGIRLGSSFAGGQISIRTSVGQNPVSLVLSGHWWKAPIAVYWTGFGQEKPNRRAKFVAEIAV